ncbi:MAG TPA: nucleotidyltransferase family protein [bacterium]|nr:nucleotidyltransferase family protein [bacterium]
MSTPEGLERFLLSLLRTPPGDGQGERIQRFLDVSSLPQLTQASEAHGILGYAYTSLRGLPDLDGKLLEDLRGRYRAAFRRHLAAIADVTRLSGVLQGLEGNWLVVEGPVLPETVYPRADLRSYDAIDLLVMEHVLGQFLDLVADAGARRLEELRDESPGASAKGDVHVLLWHETFARVWTDLGGRYRSNASPPVHEIFANSVLTELHGPPVRTLDPVTALIDLALKSEGERARHLGRLKDIERILTVCQPDWSELVERSRDWGVGRAVAMQLRAVRSTFAFPIPEPVLTALAGAVKKGPAKEKARRSGRSDTGYSAAEAALLALLQPIPRPPGPLAPAEWNQVLALAEQERLTPLVARAVDVLGLWVPAEVGGALAHAREHAGAVSALAFERFAAVLTALRARGVRPIVLKGAALARWIYADPALRPFTDIDLLVPAGDVTPTHDLLTELGYRLGTGQLTTATDLTWRHARGYYDPAGNRPTLDVHWRLAGYPFLIEVSYETLAERCAVERLDGDDLLVPSPGDAVVISSIFFLRELWYGKPRLRYLRDLAEVVARHTVDWNTVATLAQSVQFLRAPLILALSASQRLFQTPVRPEFLGEPTGSQSILLRLLVDRTCARILRREAAIEAFLLSTGLRWLDNPSLVGIAGWIKRLILVPRGLSSSQRRWLRRLVGG